MNIFWSKVLYEDFQYHPENEEHQKNAKRGKLNCNNTDHNEAIFIWFENVRIITFQSIITSSKKKLLIPGVEKM